MYPNYPYNQNVRYPRPNNQNQPELFNDPSILQNPSVIGYINQMQVNSPMPGGMGFSSWNTSGGEMYGYRSIANTSGQTFGMFVIYTYIFSVYIFIYI